MTVKAASDLVNLEGEIARTAVTAFDGDLAVIDRSIAKGKLRELAKRYASLTKPIVITLSCDRCDEELLPETVKTPVMTAHRGILFYHSAEERDCYGMAMARAAEDTCYDCWDADTGDYGCDWEDGDCDHECHAEVEMWICFTCSTVLEEARCDNCGDEADIGPYDDSNA